MKKIGIVAFAFGAPSVICSNDLIARIASWKAREFNAPVYTQLDVRIEPGIMVEFADEIPGDPPPTLRIARGAIRWAKQRGLTELWIVAAQPHIWRCARDLAESVREAGGGWQISIRICDEIDQYPEDSWFCFNSTQTRTRSRRNWQGRERAIKLIPFFIYKRITN